jgi:hypothetical protein
MTTPSIPTADFRLCPECCTSMDELRAKVGELGVGLVYCDHGPGVFAIWSCGDLVQKRCASREQAAVYEAALTTLVARAQIVAEERAELERRAAGPAN